jgi:hypothetical protein
LRVKPYLCATKLEYWLKIRADDISSKNIAYISNYGELWHMLSPKSTFPDGRPIRSRSASIVEESVEECEAVHTSKKSHLA